MTQVKICGNTNAEDAAKALGLGADYLGLIFAESKRQLDVSSAETIVKALPDFHNFVGVFYNQPREEVEAVARQLNLQWLQFHGDETALYCDYFMGNHFKVIKTFRIRDERSLRRLDEYDVSAFLFDTFSRTEKGGTGTTFDWNLVKNRPYVAEKLFLAGGLNPSNVESAIETLHPYAVDVASGVESEPGKKDLSLLKEFILKAKGGPSHEAN